MGIIIIYIICFFIFIFKGYNSLKNEINIFINLIPGKNKKYSKNIILTTDKAQKGSKNKKQKKKSKTKKIKNKSNPTKKNKRKDMNSITININNFNSNSRILKDISTSRRNIQLNQSEADNNQSNNFNNFNTQNNTNIQQQSQKRSSVFKNAKTITNKKLKRNNKNNKILKSKNLNNKILKRKSLSFRNSKTMIMNDYEINRLKYQDALKYDKRSFFQYYWSLLKAGHIGIFAFVPNNDYNSRVIKVCLFFFSFSLLYTVNSLFFTDSSMNNILVNDGNFDFLFQIVQIIYSTLISWVVNLIMKFLALTQLEILKIKIVKKGQSLDKNLILLIKKLKIKFTLFFILSFSLLPFTESGSIINYICSSSDKDLFELTQQVKFCRIASVFQSSINTSVITTLAPPISTIGVVISLVTSAVYITMTCIIGICLS